MWNGEGKMENAEWRVDEIMWEEKIRKWLLVLFFASLSLPVAIQQTALSLLLVFFAYTTAATIIRNRQRSAHRTVDIPHSTFRIPQFLSTPLDLPLLVFLGTLLFSTLWSPDILNSLAGYRKLWLVGAFFVTYHLVKDAREAWRLVALWMIVTTVIAAYGIVQHYTGIDWARALVGKASNLDPFWFGREEGFRTKGFHPSGITYAHNLLLPLIFTSVFLFSSGNSWRQWLLRLASWGLMVFALLFSLTRGVWIAYLVVLLLFGMLKGGRVFFSAGLTVVLLGLFLLSAGTGVRERARSLFDLSENLGRSRIWQANIDMIRDRPLLGWGYGNYRKFREPYYQRYPEADTTAHAHNSFLQIWVDTGLLGLGAFVYLFAVILKTSWTVYQYLSTEPGKSLALGGVLGVVGFLLGGMTQYNFGDAEVVIVLWATIGVLMRLAAETPLAREQG
jgi:hypothetical protein